jgi:hypothetical protein
MDNKWNNINKTKETLNSDGQQWQANTRDGQQR